MAEGISKVNPSPRDGLVHTSVWARLNDLTARIESLERDMVVIGRQLDNLERKV